MSSVAVRRVVRWKSQVLRSRSPETDCAREQRPECKGDGLQTHEPAIEKQPGLMSKFGLQRVQALLPCGSCEGLGATPRAFQHVLLVAPACQAEQNAEQEDDGSDCNRAHRTQLRAAVAQKFRVTPESRHHITSWVESFM